MPMNLRHFKVFTGPLSPLKANQFPSTNASTSQASYSPSQMHHSHPSTLSSLSVPSSWNWEWRKKILRQRFGRRREKCFLVSGVLKFSMCQSKNYKLPLMRPSSVGLKVFFSGCGFEFSWCFSRQRWKLFPSATHALVLFLISSQTLDIGSSAKIIFPELAHWKSAPLPK